MDWLDPWVEKIPWRRARQSSPVFFLGESQGQRSLAGYSPLGHWRPTVVLDFTNGKKYKKIFAFLKKKQICCHTNIGLLWKWVGIAHHAKMEKKKKKRESKKKCNAEIYCYMWEEAATDLTLSSWSTWAFLIAQLVRICLQCRRLPFNSWVRKTPWRRNRLLTPVFLGFPCGSVGKESACNAGDLCSISGSGRSPGEGIGCPLQYSWASLVVQLVKNLSTMQETWVWSLSWEDALEMGKATPVFWPGEFHGQFMGSQRVRHN